MEKRLSTLRHILFKGMCVLIILWPVSMVGLHLNSSIGYWPPALCVRNGEIHIGNFGGEHPGLYLHGKFLRPHWSMPRYYVVYSNSLRRTAVRIHIPIWLLFVGAGTLYATIILLQRVLKKHDCHICSKCGYDLSGLDEQIRCPECGKLK